MKYELGRNHNAQYAARQAEQRRVRIWEVIWVCVVLIIALGAVSAVGGEALFNYIGLGEL